MRPIMEPADEEDRLELVLTEAEEHREDLAQDVKEGLTASSKFLSCRFLYDAEGSRLFEQICDLPEYYLTRAERQILAERAGAIADEFEEPVALVELGSGSAVKTRLLIEAFLQRHGGLRYVPVDISRTMLEESSRSLLADYPDLEVLGVAAEYEEGLRQIGERVRQPKLILWLGSNVGNFERPLAVQFVQKIAAMMNNRNDALLIGVDLKKDRRVLEQAYDDPQGVTRAFNLNLLTRINRELDANFDVSSFDHRAIWSEERGRMEMFLVSKKTQTVRIGRLDLNVEFRENEAIHTENSAKYTSEEIDALAAGAGLTRTRTWLDAKGRFSVNLMRLQAPA